MQFAAGASGAPAGIQRGRRKADQVSDDEFANMIDQQILPPWRALEGRLRAVGRLPGDLRKHVDNLTRYMALRGQAWAVLSDAIRTDDQAKAERAVALQKEAEAVMKAPSDGKPDQGKPPGGT